MIMLVEDNVEIRSCIKEMLSPLYEVIESNHGKEAWPIISDQLPDLIVSDIAMPEMDGLELTHLIKNDERTNHIPVILLTARGATEHHVEGIETGADDYITKPFSSRELVARINAVLRRAAPEGGGDVLSFGGLVLKLAAVGTAAGAFRGLFGVGGGFVIDGDR